MTDTMNVHAYQVDSDTLVVRVRATEDSQAVRPLRLAFLLDISDSMAGDRLTALKRTLHAARDLWIPEDLVTIVTFGNVGAVRLRDHRMEGEGVSAFYEVIDGITTNGCTNLSSGLEALSSCTGSGSWDAILLLTDGQVNMGVSSTAGLYAMAQGVGVQAYYSIGYGSDHNRRLLRSLAVQTHGSYTYASSDEVLPVAIGDILSGLRTEVQMGVTVTVPEGYVCAEYGAEATNTYVVGNIVADRDYWAVFHRQQSNSSSTSDPEVSVTSIAAAAIRVPIEEAVTDELREQVLRSRVACVLADVADGMEDGHYDTAPLVALKGELDALTAAFRARPLMLRMIGQVADAVAAATTRQTHLAPPSTHLLSAISSGAAYFSVQRGTQSAEDPDVFSSPKQRMSSSSVRDHFRSSVARTPSN
jgi:hypothetical protein